MSITTRAHYDAAERKFIIERVQDVEPISELNKQLQSTPQKSESFHHVASIPNIFLEKWLNEEAARGNVMTLFSHDFDKMVFKKLRDPDWRFLKTTDKNI